MMCTHILNFCAWLNLIYIMVHLFPFIKRLNVVQTLSMCLCDCPAVTKLYLSVSFPLIYPSISQALELG